MMGKGQKATDLQRNQRVHVSPEQLGGASTLQGSAGLWLHRLQTPHLVSKGGGSPPHNPPGPRALGTDL